LPLIPRARPSRQGRLYSARRLAASATLATQGNGRVTFGRTNQPWQVRAFGYYEMLGECWNPAQFYARGMSKIRFFPAQVEDDGTLTEITDELAIDALRNVQHIAGDYGRLMFLVGEGRLCQSKPPDADPDSDILWEFLSPTEITEADEGRVIVRDLFGGTEKIAYRNISDETGEPQPGEMRMWRFWRRHPRNSGLPDSPIRAVLDLYEQLWWVTMGERADIQNRIADNGLMLIPDEIDFAATGTPEADAQGDDPEADPFQSFVGEMMMTAIGDPGAASASVPGVIRGPAEYLHPDRFRMLHTHDDKRSLVASEREKAIIERIAIGLDLPVEEVVGLSTANHWTAWKIEDQKWQHLEPVAQMLANDLASAYLRPLLRASGMDADMVTVGYDNSELMRDPDRGKTALDLNTRGLLGAIQTLEANGWGEDDLMPEEEHTEWLAIQMKSPDLLDGTVDVAPAAPDVQQPPEPSPSEQPPPDGGAALDPHKAIVARYAVKRARSIVGAMVRSRRRSCPECLEGTDGVDNAALVAALGEQRAARFGDKAEFTSAAARALCLTLQELGFALSPDLAHGFFTETFATLDTWPDDRLGEITQVG
jgi:hypothetical protein